MTGAYMKDLYFMKSGAGNSTSAAAPSDMYRSSDYDYGTEKAVVESAVQEADMDTAEENYSYKSSAGEVQDGIESNDMLSKANGVSERKLIKNGYLSITVDDFDSAVSQIREYAELNNGYIENSDSYVNYDSNFGTYGGKAGSMRVRVSGDGFSGAMEYVKGIGKVINENESTEDVTGEYVDTQSRLRVKEQEKERLMMLLEEADSMEDIIKIEARLTEVIEAIESQQARLNTFDRLIEYSTININITESDGGKMTPRGVSFTDRAGYNFKESVNALINALQGFALLIIRVWAPLAVLAAAAAVVFVIYKRKKAGKSGGKTDSKH